jgi:hypothetical protein
MAETPPYAQPTTRTRCGDESDIPPIVSERLGILIVGKFGSDKSGEVRGRVGCRKDESEMI